MADPIAPAAVSNLATILPVSVNTPNAETGGGPNNPLANVATGTTVEGFVVNRDANNNPIVRTALGDLQVTSDVFLKTGSEVVFKVDPSQANLARIITVDGVSPQEYNTQNTRGITQDTISTIGLQSASTSGAAQVAQSGDAKPANPVLQAVVLQATPPASVVTNALQQVQSALPAVVAQLRQFTQLRPGTPIKLTVLDVRLPPIPISLAALPETLISANLLEPRPAPAHVANQPASATPVPPQADATSDNPLHATPTAASAPALTPAKPFAPPATDMPHSTAPATTAPQSNVPGTPVSARTAVLSPTLPAPAPAAYQAAGFSSATVEKAPHQTTAAAVLLSAAPTPTPAIAPAPSSVATAPAPVPLTATTTADIVHTAATPQGTAPLPATQAPPVAATPPTATLAIAASPQAAVPAPTSQAPPAATPPAASAADHALPRTAPTLAAPANQTSAPLATSYARPAVTPASSAQPQVEANVIGHEADGATILHTPFATLKIYTQQPLPTGTTLLVSAQLDVEAKPLPITPFAQEEKLISTITRTWDSLDQLLSTVKASNPDLARDLQQRLPTVNHSLTSNLIAFIGGIKSGDVNALLGKRTARQLELVAPDLMARLKGDIAQMQQSYNDSPLTHWSSIMLPMMFGQELVQARLYVSKDPEQSGKTEKKEARGHRFVLEVGMSAIGQMQFDGFVKSAERTKSFDLVVRSSQPLEPELSQGIRTIFDTSTQVTGIKGQILFQTGAHHFVKPLADMPQSSSSTGGANTILA